MKKIILFSILLITLIFMCFQVIYASDGRQNVGVKIGIVSFDNLSGIVDYGYLSNSLQSSIYSSISMQEGIELISNKQANSVAEAIGLSVQDKDNLSIMMKYAAKSGVNVIIIGEYSVESYTDTITINAYVYSIAQRDVIIKISEITRVSNIYDIIDKIASETAKKIKENRTSIEIAIDKIVKEANPPKYITEPNITAMSIKGINVSWTTDKETVSSLFILSSEDANNVLFEYSDSSKNAIYHLVKVPITLMKDKKDYYYICNDLDFIGNKLESKIGSIKYQKVYTEVKGQYEKKKNEELEKVDKFKEKEKYEDAYITLMKFKDVIEEYSVILDDIYEDIIDIDNKIENLKETSEIIPENIVIKDDDDNKDGDSKKSGKIITYYNHITSPEFQHDVMISAREFLNGYNLMALASSFSQLGMMSTYLIFGFVTLGQEVDSEHLAGPFILGGLYSISAIISIGYFTNGANLNSIVKGIDSGKKFFSAEYEKIRRIYKNISIINWIFGISHIVIGAVSIGIANDFKESEIEYLKDTLRPSMIILGLSSFILGITEVSITRIPFINATKLVNETMNLYYRDLFREGYVFASGIESRMVVSFFNSFTIVGAIMDIIIRDRTNKTLKDIENGMIFVGDGCKKIIDYYNFYRGSHIANSIISLAAGSIVVPIIGFLSCPETYYTGLGSIVALSIGSISSIVSLFGMINLFILPKNFPQEDFYSNNIGEESFGKETYNGLFIRHTFIEAKKRLFYQKELLILQITGTAGALTGLVFSLTRPDADKAFGYVILSAVVLGGSGIVPFYFTNRKGFYDILDSIDKGKISFSEGYKELKTLYSKLSTLNAINGTIYTCGGIFTLIYSIVKATPTINFNHFLGFTISSAFLLTTGISDIVQAFKKLPDPKNYNIENTTSLSVNFSPYPVIDDSGISGIGLNILFNW